MIPADNPSAAKIQDHLPVRFHRAYSVPEITEAIEVWILHRDSPWRAIGELESLLTDNELVRARRYSIDEPRRQFVQHRASLRLLLGSFLNQSPRNVTIEASPDGKPIVIDEEVHFNVTHSADWGAIVMAKRPVGVDLEVIRPMPNAEGLISRFFTREEQKQYSRLPIDFKHEGFFRGWICKEAVLKTTGVGLRKLESCTVDLDPRNVPAVLRDDAQANWQLTLKAIDSMRMCVAVQLDVEGFEPPTTRV